jgi:hypothetical protein
MVFTVKKIPRRKVSVSLIISLVSGSGSALLNRTRLSGSGGDFAGFGISGCRLVIGALGRAQPPHLRLFETVAFAVQFQNMNVMGKAIK